MSPAYWMVARVCPRATSVSLYLTLPRAGRVRVSVDNEGRVRVRAKGAVPDLQAPGFALGELRFGEIDWDPRVLEHVTLTATEREAIGAWLRTGLARIHPEWWRDPRAPA